MPKSGTGKSIVKEENQEGEDLVVVKPPENVTQLLTVSQMNIINAATPRESIKQRVGRGGKEFNYVDIGYVIKTLNHAFTPLGWDFKITDKIEKPTEVVVQGELTIKDHRGNFVTKTQFGQADFRANVPFGDVYKAATSDALKKCASLLGIALDVYSPNLDTTQGGTTETPERREVQTGYGGGKATDKQVKLLRVIMGAASQATGRSQADLEAAFKKSAGVEHLHDVPFAMMSKSIDALLKKYKDFMRPREEVHAEEVPTVQVDEQTDEPAISDAARAILEDEPVGKTIEPNW